MFLIWTTDHCPYRTNSVASRWPFAVIPKSLYFMDPDGINATLAAATAELVASFNKLSRDGITVRDFPSLGGATVASQSIENVSGFPLKSFLPENYQQVYISAPVLHHLRPGWEPEVFRDGVQRRLEGVSPGVQPRPPLQCRGGVDLIPRSSIVLE